jgi:hypothetical protein
MRGRTKLGRHAHTEAIVSRLIVATLCGTALAAVVVFDGLLLRDDGAFTILQALYRLTTWGDMFGVIVAILLLFGAIPTIVIGAVLILIRRSSPILLVATPAALFLFILIEMVREMRDATPALQVLPAMVAGGLLMFVMLSRPAARPPEKMFA